jgi:hypothetical protein
MINKLKRWIYDTLKLCQFEYRSYYLVICFDQNHWKNFCRQAKVNPSTGLSYLSRRDKFLIFTPNTHLSKLMGISGDDIALIDLVGDAMTYPEMYEYLRSRRFNV